MKRPMVGLSLTFACGILLGWWLRPTFWVCAGATLVFLLGFVLLNRTALSRWVLFGAVLFAGAAWHASAVSVVSPRDIRNLIPDGRSQNVEIRGIIVSDPRYQSFESDIAPLQSLLVSGGTKSETATPAQARVDFLVELSAIKLIDTWHAAEVRVLTYVRFGREPNPFRYGQEVRLAGVIEQPRPPRNPGQFDFPSYLSGRSTFFLLRCGTLTDAEIQASGRGNPLVAGAIAVRDRLNATLHRGLVAGGEPTEREEQVAGLLSGMLLGYREKIPDGVRQSFVRTGAMHIFAISGLHVGMIAAILVIVLRLIRVPRRWCALPAIPILFFYVMATGLRPSALRAFIMAAVFLSCWTFVRPADALNSLGAAGCVVLVLDPLQLFDGGFQMSFAVVASIIVFMPRFERIFGRPFQPDPFIPSDLLPRWRRGLRVVGWRVAQWFSLTVAAWLGSLPFMAYYFNIFSPISILGNMVVVALAFCIVATGFLAILASLVSSWLVVTFNCANFAFGTMMIRFTEVLSSVPYGYRYVATPPVVAVVFYFAACVAMTSRWLIRLRWRRSLSAGTCAALLSAGAWFWRLEDLPTRVTFLDVGSGSSIFVDAPGESHDVLINAGREEAGRYVVEPFLRSRGVDELPRVIVTAADVARAGGMKRLLPNFKIGELVDSGWRSSYSSTQREILVLVRTLGVPMREVRAGDVLSAGPNREIRVFHPQRDKTFRTMDDNALVLQIRNGPHRILLMSSTGETVEKLLMESGEDLRSDVVMRSPHRKEDICTEAFLDRVRPRAVVLARGGQSGGQSASPEAQERMAARRIAVYDTLRCGAVTVEMRGERLEIKTVLRHR